MKKQEIYRKSPMKMCKNSDFRYFRPEKVFIKNRTGPYFGHCCYTFLNKESIKTNDEILRKCKKPGFSGKFLVFSAGKICFSEIGLRQILEIAILQQCAKMKKYKVQLEKFKKYHFSGENRLFWRILGSSSYKNQFY